MISNDFQFFNKTMAEIIEFMKKLEVLETTNKQSWNKKGDMEKSEDETGKYKSKAKIFYKTNPKYKGRKI